MTRSQSPIFKPVTVRGSSSSEAKYDFEIFQAAAIYEKMILDMPPMQRELLFSLAEFSKQKSILAIRENGVVGGQDYFYSLLGIFFQDCLSGTTPVKNPIPSQSALDGDDFDVLEDF